MAFAMEPFAFLQPPAVPTSWMTDLENPPVPFLGGPRIAHILSMPANFFGVVFSIGLCALAARAQDASAIVKRADQKLRGESSRGELTVRIVRPDWSREMALKFWSLGDDYALMLITEPARDRGTVFLKRDREIWNWIPRIERHIKLPPSMMTQSWMGTDFTNDDLINQSSLLEDYTHAPAGDSTILDRGCWRIELRPRPDAAVVWNRIVLWVDKQDYMEMRMEFFDEKDEIVTVARASDIRKLGGRLLPATLEWIPVDEPGHRTVLHYESLDFDLDLKEPFFSLQNMKRVR